MPVPSTLKWCVTCPSLGLLFIPSLWAFRFGQPSAQMNGWQSESTVRGFWVWQSVLVQLRNVMRGRDSWKTNLFNVPSVLATSAATTTPFQSIPISLTLWFWTCLNIVCMYVHGLHKRDPAATSALQTWKWQKCRVEAYLDECNEQNPEVTRCFPARTQQPSGKWWRDRCDVAMHSLYYIVLHSCAFWEWCASNVVTTWCLGTPYLASMSYFARVQVDSGWSQTAGRPQARWSRCTWFTHKLMVVNINDIECGWMWNAIMILEDRGCSGCNASLHSLQWGFAHLDLWTVQTTLWGGHFDLSCGTGGELMDTLKPCQQLVPRLKNISKQAQISGTNMLYYIYREYKIS